MRDWLFHRAQVSPDMTALITAKDGREWDYAALDASVEQMAGRLSALGIEEGDHIGMLTETRVEAVELVHAAMRLGAVLVPLNTRLTADELTEQVDHANLTALVCGQSTEPRAVESSGDVPVVSLDDPNWEGVAHLATQPVESVTPAEWHRTDIQTMLFTSGTTGEPKAVAHQMWNHLASAVASAFRLGVLPTDRWLVTLALYHTGGLAPILRSTLYGTTVVLRSEFEPGPAADDIATYDVTGVSLVPTMLRDMLDARGTLADSLRTVLLGGAPAPAELIERCRDYSVPVCPTYGMTETASQIATALPEEAFEHLGTVGRPLLWTDVTIIDEEGEAVDPGETGELVVSGPTVTPGYYGDPEATEAASSEHGLRTGDIGHRDEAGNLWILNRRDDRIITGGENVDPGEVVGVLRQHPEVDAAAVVGLPDERWGERVAALVVRSSESDLSAEDLEEHCRESLAGYKMPKTIQFTEGLPRTASGTVERPVVRERLLENMDSDELADSEPAESDGSEEKETDDAELAESEATEQESEEMESKEPGAEEDGSAEDDSTEDTASEDELEWVSDPIEDPDE